MNQDQFRLVYAESRNGANDMIRHPLFRKLIYSDGIHDLCETGVYWLLDIFGTEVVKAMQGADSLGVIKVVVADSGAKLSLSLEDDAPNIWTREIEFTDMPDGEWKFFITNDGSGECTLILMSEY